MKRRSSLRSQKSFAVSNIAEILPFGGVSSFVLIGLGFLIFIVSIFSPQSVSGIRMSVSDAFAPILSMASKPVVQTAEVVRNASGLGDLQSENIRLKQENLRLKEWYQTALLLEAENQSLRDLLNVKVEPHYKTVTARILADTGNAFVKSVLVSAGTNDGVQKGQAVMAGEGLIGRVIEAGETTSRVLLITDINSRVPVLIEDTRQHAILAGHNKEFTKLLHLTQDSEVQSGARIITSGHGGLFPHGLIIGKIEKDKNSDITVKPFTDFSKIVHVRILDQSSDPNFLPAGSNKSLNVLQ